MLEWDMQFHVFRMIENGVWAREHSCSSSWNLEPTNESISLNACKSIIKNRLMWTIFSSILVVIID